MSAKSKSKQTAKAMTKVTAGSWGKRGASTGRRANGVQGAGPVAAPAPAAGGRGRKRAREEGAWGEGGEAMGGESLHARILAELRGLGEMGGVEPGASLAGARRGDGAGGEGDDDEVEAEDDDGDEGGTGSGPHHIHYDRAKGWVLRVTVDVGNHVVGKRLKFRLRTRDAAEAEKARDLVLATLKRLGLRVRLRVQGRRRSEVGGRRSVIGDR